MSGLQDAALLGGAEGYASGLHNPQLHTRPAT